ncbi:MAG TPA: polynucleotide adenylyltransferase, partial [Clostridiales bacterium]|nr:polynucleotide adenylyltransferase [Clostridiales bacterium]
MVKDKGFKYVYDKLIKNGFKAYLVGGAVRDYLLKRKCYDLDVATSALPEQILAVFETEKKVLTGLKHGTVGVIVYGKNYEVTTFRQDGEYNDFRHPSDVNFVSDLKTDLSRRDFTINAMAYSETEGVIDYFNG